MYEYEGETEAESAQIICFDGPMDMDMALMLHQPITPPLFHLPTNLTKTSPHSCSERVRRVHLNAKYDALAYLIPNPTKLDKASIVEDAIAYIKDLLTTIDHLKILLLNHNHNHNHNHSNEVESSSFITTSWFQTKSRHTEVDVRIAHDQLTINLLQRNKANGLFCASQALQHLHLDPHHVAGAHFGYFNSFFFFNIKLHDASCVSATAIANKLVEVGDKQ